MQYNIREITSNAIVPGKKGKWYCSTSKIVESIKTTRYLQTDGTWDKITDYFDSKQEIEELLKSATQPTFEVTWKDHYKNQVIQDDLNHLMNEDNDY